MVECHKRFSSIFFDVKGGASNVERGLRPVLRGERKFALGWPNLLFELLLKPLGSFVKS